MSRSQSRSGSAEEKQKQQRAAKRQEKRLQKVSSADVFLTSYGVFRADVERKDFFREAVKLDLFEFSAVKLFVLVYLVFVHGFRQRISVAASCLLLRVSCSKARRTTCSEKFAKIACGRRSWPARMPFQGSSLMKRNRSRTTMHRSPRPSLGLFCMERGLG